MKKRIVAALLLVSLMAVSLAGCGEKELSNDYIKVKKYKGLEVDKVEVTEVTDVMVEDDIQNTLKSNAKTNEITDRKVAEGDVANIDYVGKIDGEEFEGGSYEGYDMEVGNANFIDGFEDGLVGLKPGETVDLELAFPEDYSNEEVAGKDVVFTVTVNYIAESEVPELTDDFVKSVSEESTTVDEYKEEVKKTLTENYEADAEETLQNEVWSKLLENIEVIKYPEGKVEESKESLAGQYESMAGYYGMEMADFLTNYMGMTEEQFDEKMLESAQSSVKGEIALELIAEKEKLTPTDEEYKAKYEEYVEMYGYEDVDALIEAAGEETLQQIALQEVVLDWLVDNCVQVEPTEKETKEETKDAADDSKDKDAADDTADEKE